MLVSEAPLYLAEGIGRGGEQNAMLWAVALPSLHPGYCNSLIKNNPPPCGHRRVPIKVLL